MTDYTPAGQKMANQLLVGQGRRRDLGIERLCNELGELCARVEALEGKYETMRLATLEWGKDVDNVKRWSDQHLQRLEALEANSKPTPNSSQTGRSLVERVQAAIHDVEFPHGNDEARAAIREVAGWLHEAHLWEAADVLEQEAER